MSKIVFLESDNRREIQRWVDVDLGDGDWGVSSEDVVQTAISWCITHDNEAVHEQGTGCYQAIAIGNWSDCVISTGGFDHKWWKDETWTRQGEKPDDG